MYCCSYLDFPDRFSFLRPFVTLPGSTAHHLGAAFLYPTQFLQQLEVHHMIKCFTFKLVTEWTRSSIWSHPALLPHTTHSFSTAHPQPTFSSLLYRWQKWYLQWDFPGSRTVTLYIRAEPHRWRYGKVRVTSTHTKRTVNTITAELPMSKRNMGFQQWRTK